MWTYNLNTDAAVTGMAFDSVAASLTGVYEQAGVSWSLNIVNTMQNIVTNIVNRICPMQVVINSPPTLTN